MSSWLDIIEDEAFVATVATLSTTREVPDDVALDVVTREQRAKEYVDVNEGTGKTVAALRTLGQVAALRSFGVIPAEVNTPPN